MTFLASVVIGMAISIIAPLPPSQAETVGLATGVVKVVRDSHGHDWGGVHLKNGGGIMVGAVIGREIRNDIERHKARAPEPVPPPEPELLPGDRVLKSVYGDKAPAK